MTDEAARRKEAPPEEEALRTAHRSLGTLYEARASAPEATWGDVWQAVDHLLLAKEAERAWPLAEKYLGALTARGGIEEALSLLDRCEAAGLSGDKLGRLIVIRFDLRTRLGAPLGERVSDVGRALAAAETDATRGLVMHRLGRAAIEEGDAESAAALMQQAEAYAKAAYGEGHVEHLAALQDFGALLASQGRGDDAEAALRQAVTQGEKAFQQDLLSPRLFAAWIGNLAAILAARGQWREAGLFLERAVALAEQDGAEGTELGTLLKDLAEVRCREERWEQAAALAGRAISELEAQVGPTDPLLSPALIALGDALFAVGRSVESEGLFRRARTLLVAAHGDEHPESVEALAKLAQAELAAGNPQALETSAEAVRAMREVLGTGHPITQRIGARLQAMLTAMGHTEEEEPPEPTPDLTTTEGLETALRQAISALEANRADRAITLLSQVADRAHDAKIAPVEAAAAGLLGQALSMVGERPAALVCTERAMTLAEELGQTEAAARFRALFEVLKAEEGAAPPDA